MTANGNNSNNGTSESSGWASLIYACSQVPPNQGNTIKLGIGTFLDPDRLTGNGNRAILPKGVNLVGSGRTRSIYKGEIYVPTPGNQNVSDFFIDGRENTTAGTTKFSGLIIQDKSNIQASNVHVFNMRIEGFYSMGLQLGFWNGLKDSSLHDCELVNNGAHNKRGFGMRTGNLVNSDIYNNTFIEERGKGGEVWNSGVRDFTNVKIHNNYFSTHGDTAAGWQGQYVFNFELFQVDCINVEVYKNRFDGSVSLVDKPVPRTGKTSYSIRVHDNRWEYTKRYCIEMSMSHMIVDNNYFHFAQNLNPDIGGGYTALASFGYASSDIVIHHNVFDNIVTSGIYNLKGNDVKIYNNTVTGGRRSEVGGGNVSQSPVFIQVGDSSVTRTNWSIMNNVYRADPARSGMLFRFDAATYNMPGLKISNNVVYNATSGLSAALLSQANVQQPVTVNPKFVEYGARPEPFYALLPASSLVDAGANISGITNGYTGSAPDIGAIEGPANQNAPLLPLGSELVENGGFEIPSSNISFGFTPEEGVIGWANVGIQTTSITSSSDNPYQGARHAQIYATGWDNRSIAQTTAHVNRQNDVFTLKFRHNITGAWNPDLALRLFYEDNGQRIPFYSWVDSYDWWNNKTSTNPSAQPWRAVTLSGLTVPAAAVGRPIGIWFTNNISSQSVYVDAVSLVRTAGPTGVVVTPVLIASEGFESGTWSGGTGWSDSKWTLTGKAYVVPTAAQGTYSAQIRSVGSSITRSVNLANTSNVNLKVAIRRYSLETGDTAALQFYDGTQWINLETFAGNGGFNYYVYDLSAVPMNSNGSQKIRLKSGLGDPSDFVYIDAIQIRGVQ